MTDPFLPDGATNSTGDRMWFTRRTRIVLMIVYVLLAVGAIVLCNVEGWKGLTAGSPLIVLIVAVPYWGIVMFVAYLLGEW